MSKIIDTGLSIAPSVELFLTHYRYGLNRHESTVLVDLDGFIIAYWDNCSPLIDVIQASIPHKGKYIIANGIMVERDKPIRFVPMAYSSNDARLIKTSSVGDREVFLDEQLKEINEVARKYNKSYFVNLFLDKQNIGN